MRFLKKKARKIGLFWKLRRSNSWFRLLIECYFVNIDFREYSRLGNDVDLKVYNQRTIIVLGGTICAVILTFIELIVRLIVVYKQFVPVVFLPLFLYAKVQLTIIFILRRTKALRIVDAKITRLLRLFTVIQVLS